MLNFLSLAAVAGGAVLSASAPAMDSMDLPGVKLGMSREAWSALPFPGATSARARPICSDDGTAQSNDLTPSVADRKNGTVLCAYRELIGRFSLPTTVNLGPKLRIQHLRFAFRQGRLMRVDYQVSVNAFDDVTARLTQRYGPPAKLIHDDVKTELGAFPRIRQVWVTSSAWIELVDPVAPFNQMGVELTIKPAATGRKAS